MLILHIKIIMTYESLSTYINFFIVLIKVKINFKTDNFTVLNLSLCYNFKESNQNF